MALREVSVTEIREVLRLWLAGEGLRSIERLASLTARRSAGMCRRPRPPGWYAMAANAS